METIGLIASVVLGGLFLLAGASKIAAGEMWPRQALDLGAPGVVIPIAPWFEMAVGAMLIAQVARLVAATLAIVALVAFTVLIVRQLRKGHRPPCACFGGWSSKPIGPENVVRNVAMIVLGAIAIVAR